MSLDISKYTVLHCWNSRPNDEEVDLFTSFTNTWKALRENTHQSEMKGNMCFICLLKQLDKFDSHIYMTKIKKLYTFRFISLHMSLLKTVWNKYLLNLETDPSDEEID